MTRAPRIALLLWAAVVVAAVLWWRVPFPGDSRSTANNRQDSAVDEAGRRPHDLVLTVVVTTEEGGVLPFARIDLASRPLRQNPHGEPTPAGLFSPSSDDVLILIDGAAIRTFQDGESQGDFHALPSDVILSVKSDEFGLAELAVPPPLSGHALVVIASGSDTSGVRHVGAARLAAADRIVVPCRPLHEHSITFRFGDGRAPPAELDACLALDTAGAWQWKAMTNAEHNILAPPPDSGRLRVRSPRHACASTVLRWTLPSAHTVIDVIGLCVVRVLDAASRAPVPKFRAIVWDAEGRPLRKLSGDHTGALCFNSAEIDFTNLPIGPLRLLVTAPGYESVETTIDPVASAGEDAEVLLKPSAGRVVRGQVSSATLPIHGIRVSVAPRRERRGWSGPLGNRDEGEVVAHTLSDTAGAFMLTGVPSSPLTLILVGEGATLELPLEPGQDWLDIRFDVCASVSGTLQDEVGTPLEAHTVCLEGDVAGLFKSVTAPDGVFSFERVPLGMYRLGLRGSDRAQQLRIDQISPIAGLTISEGGPRRREITLRVQGPGLEGARVRDASGLTHSLSGPEVFKVKARPGDAIHYRLADGREGEWAVSREATEAGSLTVTVAASVELVAVVDLRASGWSLSVPDCVAVLDSGQERVPCELREGRRVHVLCPSTLSQLELSLELHRDRTTRYVTARVMREAFATHTATVLVPADVCQADDKMREVAFRFLKHVGGPPLCGAFAGLKWTPAGAPHLSVDLGSGVTDSAGIARFGVPGTGAVEVWVTFSESAILLPRTTTRMLNLGGLDVNTLDVALR